ncbi:MAG TPA: hypothetical protein VN873_04935 [Candidatus Angelobacter sp.]|nr:hypothetical protein [Candidatus Angelobacter sp.]
MGPERGGELVGDGLSALAGVVFGEDFVLAQRSPADDRQDDDGQQDKNDLPHKGRLALDAFA